MCVCVLQCVFVYCIMCVFVCLRTTVFVCYSYSYVRTVCFAFNVDICVGLMLVSFNSCGRLIMLAKEFQLSQNSRLRTRP
jgi:hypothetical protein